MIGIRFPFTRTRHAWFIKTRWFALRFYPPAFPHLDVWRIL